MIAIPQPRPARGRARRGRPLVAAALAALVVTIGTASGASAAAPPTPAPVSGPVTHPDADHAGSGLAGSGHPVAITPSVTQTPGLDVSSYQGNVDWAAVKANGARFAYVKATEGTNYQNPYFAQQYNGAYNEGGIRGAYHFGLPGRSAGGLQADYLVDHGGGWSPDGRTLPPALDIEYNPYGPTCYGLSYRDMVSWIRAFSDEVHARTGRYPVIYSTTDWWQTCTGNYGGFGATNPLWIARYASTAGTLPAGWSHYTFWQYADQGRFPGDQDVFNGTPPQLRAFATGRSAQRSAGQ